MFTGIIEQLGTVNGLRREGTNLHLTIRAAMAPELRVDQSVSHNGVCLTVVSIDTDTHVVTAVHETLDHTNLGALRVGDAVNLERCLRAGDRLDGHMVQGHVDTVTECLSVEDMDGSWAYTFRLPEEAHLLVQKGSICLNGVSLTVASLTADTFSVAIIPYTYAHTTFQHLRAGHGVNVEFDVLGKYVARLAKR